MTLGKPTVSDLLSLLDKPALLNWANKQGLKGIDISKKRQDWLSRGTSIHKQVELFHLEQKPFENPEHQENYLRYIEGKEIVCLEKKVETNYFQGRYDCCLIHNKKKYLIDYKSTTKMKVYFENKLQLVAYGMAEEVDSFAIVAVPSFSFIEVTIEDRKPYEEIIKALSCIYYYKQRILEYETTGING